MNKVNKVNRDPQAKMEQWERVALREKKVNPDLLDHLVKLELGEEWEVWEMWVKQESLAKLVHLEKLVCLVCQVKREILERKEVVVYLENLVMLLEQV